MINFCQQLLIDELIDTLETDLACFTDPDWDGDIDDVWECSRVVIEELRRRFRAMHNAMVEWENSNYRWYPSEVDIARQDCAEVIKNIFEGKIFRENL